MSCFQPPVCPCPSSPPPVPTSWKGLQLHSHPQWVYLQANLGIGLEPVRRTARPSKKTAVSGYGRVDPSRLLGSEIEKRTDPGHPGRTRPFRRVLCALKSCRRPCVDQCNYNRSSILPAPICKGHRLRDDRADFERNDTPILPSGRRVHTHGNGTQFVCD
jgi:hypothetical protein